jgi:hypothetical protein
LSFCPLSFGHCIVCPFLIYGFWLPLWYLQHFLTKLFQFDINQKTIHGNCSSSFTENDNYCWVLCTISIGNIYKLNILHLYRYSLIFQCATSATTSIFSHCAIVELYVNYNFYYETMSYKMNYFLNFKTMCPSIVHIRLILIYLLQLIADVAHWKIKLLFLFNVKKKIALYESYCIFLVFCSFFHCKITKLITSIFMWILALLSSFKEAREVLNNNKNVNYNFYYETMSYKMNYFLNFKTMCPSIVHIRLILIYLLQLNLRDGPFNHNMIIDNNAVNKYPCRCICCRL